jgi:hypothetical protein
MFLKQSTAVTLKIGPFIDETDGKTAETGLTISQADVRLSKNGGDIAQKNESTACTHDELGIYGCPLDATDTGTLGILQLFVHESGALPVWHNFVVVPANTYDSLVSGSDSLQVDTVEISGDSAAADNAELDYDGTGYDKANSKIGEATALTATERNAISDAALSRGVSNVEDTADTTSLAAIILAILESSISGTTWTIKKTGGTTFVTKTIATDAAADPIISVT